MPERLRCAQMVLGVSCFVVSAAAFVHAEDLRDPFMFGPRTEVAAQTGPSLIGVIWDATQPLAIVGEQTVALGDRVAYHELRHPSNVTPRS